MDVEPNQAGRPLVRALTITCVYLLLVVLWFGLTAAGREPLLRSPLAPHSLFAAGVLVASTALLFAAAAGYPRRFVRQRRTPADLLLPGSAAAAVLDRNGEILATSGAWPSLASAHFGTDRGLTRGTNLLSACQAAAERDGELAEWMAQLRDVLRTGTRAKTVWADGTTAEARHYRASAVPYPALDGALVDYTDVTDLYRNQTRCTLWQKACEMTSSGVFIADPDGRLNDTDPLFPRLAGSTNAALAGQSLWDLPLVRRHPEIGTAFAEASESGECSLELLGEDAAGSPYVYRLKVATASPGTALTSYIVGAVDDLSTLREYEGSLAFERVHDALTGLGNRAMLEHDLGECIARARRYERQAAVLFMDLDGFKTINDSLGHDTGDVLLRAVAERLRETVRESDTVVRISGDEFAVLLQEISEDADAALVADKLTTVLREPVTVGSRELHVSGSIGIACFPRDGTDVGTLLRNADSAMYEAKAVGGNTFQLFHKELAEQAQEAHALTNELRVALERNQFSLAYQPVVDLRTGRITGAEALLRWQHPTFGLLPPGRFIRYLEGLGLICEVGLWVLTEACRTAANWPGGDEAGPRITVNISPLQLRQDMLLDRIQDVLTSAGLAPHRLELEITESAIARNPDAAARMLAEMRAMGLTIAIDDFGTGHSSLTLLRRFQANNLKLDRSFVSGLAESKDDQTIANTIVSLGHNLGMGVIAEGIETEAQWQFLRKAGCSEGQGYLFSLPLESADMDWLLGTHKTLPAYRAETGND